MKTSWTKCIKSGPVEKRPLQLPTHHGLTVEDSQSHVELSHNPNPGYSQPSTLQSLAWYFIFCCWLSSRHGFLPARPRSAWMDSRLKWHQVCRSGFKQDRTEGFTQLSKTPTTGKIISSQCIVRNKSAIRTKRGGIPDTLNIWLFGH